MKSIDRDLGFQGKDMLVLKNRKASNDKFLQLVKQIIRRYFRSIF